MHNITKIIVGASTLDSASMYRVTTTFLGKERGTPSTSNSYEDQDSTTIAWSITSRRRSGDSVRTLHG